jgi:hypothetical protein
MTLDNILIDKRVVQRNIERGKVDAAEYADMLRSLPDLSSNVWRRPEAHEAQSQHPAAPSPASSEAANVARNELGLPPPPQPWLQG